MVTKADLRHAALDWFVPPAIRHAAVRARSRLVSRITPTEQAILARNARLQNAYSGRKCFVLANGPSLAAVDIDLVRDEVTVVMNHYNQHAAIQRWQPTVHCAAEPADAYGDADRLQVLTQLLAGYSSTTHIFPIEMNDLFDRTGLVPPERLALVKLDRKGAEAHDAIDLTRPMPRAPDTSVLAVSVAIAMGCNPIVLLGLDYSWPSHRSINQHFYDDAAVPWGPEDMSQQPYIEVLRQAIPCWESHTELRRIAARTGQTILNATEGSFLDVYETVPLREVLSTVGRAPAPRTD